MMLSSCSRFLLLLFLIAISSVKATPRRDSRIIGGQEILTPVPFMVSMLVDNKHNCGGAIINERTVISAAHCCYYDSVDSIKIHIGDNFKTITKDSKVFDIVAKHMHPNYNYDNHDNDIVLFRLSQSLHYNERIQPIALIERDAVIDYEGLATVYGWGRIKSGGPQSEVLKFVDLPMVERNVCQRIYPQLLGSMICAGDTDGKIDSCKKDSGGPLVQNNQIIGIVSWGNGCAVPGYVGVYSNVQMLRPWVEETLEREYGESI